MKRPLILTTAILMILGTNTSVAQGDADNFYKSNSVNTEKVSFSNQYKMKVGARLFLPKELEEGRKYPAVIVGHPMGAVKEQSAGLYATKLAECGFVTLALDLSFWGESDGEPRNAVLPDVYSEDFSAAVDFLGTRPFVDRERIGVVGICGSGSFAISAAKIDPRLKAIATVSMYDMGAASRNGLKHALSPEQRKRIIAQAARTALCRIPGRGTPLHRRHSTRTDGRIHADRARILRILPYAARGVHPRRGHAAHDYAPHTDQQREIHELLPLRRHRDHLAAAAALHRR